WCLGGENPGVPLKTMESPLKFKREACAGERLKIEVKGQVVVLVVPVGPVDGVLDAISVDRQGPQADQGAQVLVLDDHRFGTGGFGVEREIVQGLPKAHPE